MKINQSAFHVVDIADFYNGYTIYEILNSDDETGYIAAPDDEEIYEGDPLLTTIEEAKRWIDNEKASAQKMKKMEIPFSAMKTPQSFNNWIYQNIRSKPNLTAFISQANWLNDIDEDTQGYVYDNLEVIIRYTEDGYEVVEVVDKNTNESSEGNYLIGKTKNATGRVIKMKKSTDAAPDTLTYMFDGETIVMEAMDGDEQSIYYLGTANIDGFTINVTMTFFGEWSEKGYGLGGWHKWEGGDVMIEMDDADFNESITMRVRTMGETGYADIPSALSQMYSDLYHRVASARKSKVKKKTRYFVDGYVKADIYTPSTGETVNRTFELWGDHYRADDPDEAIQIAIEEELVLDEELVDFSDFKGKADEYEFMKINKLTSSSGKEILAVVTVQDPESYIGGSRDPYFNVVFLDRAKDPDESAWYGVGIGYDSEDGSWSYGRYDFPSYEAALARATEGVKVLSVNELKKGNVKKGDELTYWVVGFRQSDDVYVTFDVEDYDKAIELADTLKGGQVYSVLDNMVSDQPIYDVDVHKAKNPTRPFDAYNMCLKYCKDNKRKGMTSDAMRKVIGCDPRMMLNEYIAKGMIKTTGCKEGTLYIFTGVR